MTFPLYRSSNFAIHGRQEIPQLSLHRHGPNYDDAFLPYYLVLRRMLAEQAVWIVTHLDDFIFLIVFSIALNSIFPTVDDNILREIKNSRIDLGLELQMAYKSFRQVAQTNVS